MPLERIVLRTAEVGDGLYARRALPHGGRRMVGAWCFLDHLGPLAFEAGRGLRVGPHPHIGLQTFTWMIEGEVVHRDSLGNEQALEPGQVNLMSAGHGISHAEDSPAGRSGSLHAVQLWIALDQAHRHGAPVFRNYPELPMVIRGGYRISLLVGSAFGLASPVAVHSPLLAMDLVTATATSCEIPLDPAFEHALLPLLGDFDVDGVALDADAMGYLAPGGQVVRLDSRGPARCLLIGGAPFGEDILLWWNFVARTQEEIHSATADWNSGTRFGKVHGSPSPPLRAPGLAGLHLRAPSG